MRQKDSSIGLYEFRYGPDQAKRIERDYPGINVVVDKTVRFISDVMPAVVDGYESCTIRYEPDKDGRKSIVVPKTIDNLVDVSVYDEDYVLHPYGQLEIAMVVVARVDEFPYFAMVAESGDAFEGYMMRERMVRNLSEIYEKKLGGRTLQDDDYLTGFFISGVIPE